MICLMTAAVINREVQNMGVATTSAAPIDSSQGLVASPTVTASNLTLVGGGHWSPLDARKMGIAVTLTLVVGLIQVCFVCSLLLYQVSMSYLAIVAINGCPGELQVRKRKSNNVKSKKSSFPSRLRSSCFSLFCLVLSCLVLSCLVLPCLVLSRLVLFCLVSSRLVLFYLVLS